MNQLFSFVGTVRRTVGRVLVMLLKTVFFSLIGIGAGIWTFYALGSLNIVMEIEYGAGGFIATLWRAIYIFSFLMALGCGILSYVLHRDRNKI